MKRKHTLLAACIAASLLWGMPSADAVEPAELHAVLVRNAAAETVLPIENCKALNKRITQACFVLADLTTKDVVHGDDLRAALAGSELLAGDCWHRGSLMTEEAKSTLLTNQNQGKIADEQEAGYGIIVRRSNVRVLPEGFGIFSAKEDMIRDRLQITALDPGEAVRLIHRSSDLKYWFVQASTACGWVASSDIAKTKDRKDWLRYAEPESFVLVVSRGLKVKHSEGTVYCQMGARLPLQEDKDDTYQVRIPVRGSGGNLVNSSAKLDKTEDLHVGWLDYTEQNLAKQALVYHGAPYGWHGQKNSEDCAGAAADIYRTMGITLPALGKQQADVLTREAASLPNLRADKEQIILTVGTVGARDYILTAQPDTGIRVIGAE